MKVWPIDPLVPRNLRLEVPEKLPQGLTPIPRALRHNVGVSKKSVPGVYAKRLVGLVAQNKKKEKELLGGKTLGSCHGVKL